MLLKEVLTKSIQFLKDKKIDSPRLDSEILISRALKLKRIDLYLKYEQPLQKPEVDYCRELIVRRSKGEPVAYILEEKEFYGFPFKVGPGVLIPRPETELIIDQVIAWAEENKPEEEVRILDLGAGTGCIGLTLLKKLPNSKLVSIERSAEAFSYLKQNTQDLELSDRAELVHSDVMTYQALELFDVIVANPPYIAANDPNVMSDVKNFEPSTSLFAENNGLGDLMNWTNLYVKNLKASSMMMMEMGADQGAAILDHYQQLGVFSTIEIKKDLSSLDRFVFAKKIK